MTHPNCPSKNGQGIGLALSGGGSRAMAFHLGCLRALQELKLLDCIGVLSTISGGSVIGAYYAYTPQKTFAEFEADVRSFLRSGFQASIAWEFFKPHNLIRCAGSFALTRLAEAVAMTVGKELGLVRAFSRTDLFRSILNRDVYGGIPLSAPRRNNVDVIIGACELRYGSAFRFGNSLSGDWRRGAVVDTDLDVAFAVAASAAYPLFLPALDRVWKFRKGTTDSEQRVCLTDGGVYDNLGLQVLEPDRDPAISLHCFPCEYLIVCNAGHGQESGQIIPRGFYRRVSRSFSIIHRRVQDSAMNRLHHLRNSGAIKGFVLPYLGQLDDRLPSKPEGLVPRGDVIGYGTDFAPMSDEWIERLSSRGEQLTKCLLAHYLPGLLATVANRPEQIGS